MPSPSSTIFAPSPRRAAPALSVNTNVRREMYCGATDPFRDPSSATLAESLLQQNIAAETSPTQQQQQQQQQQRRTSKRLLVRELARAVVHPRKTRQAKRLLHAQQQEAAERERIRNIEEFLASGRNGPKW